MHRHLCLAVYARCVLSSDKKKFNVYDAEQKRGAVSNNKKNHFSNFKIPEDTYENGSQGKSPRRKYHGDYSLCSD